MAASMPAEGTKSSEFITSKEAHIIVVDKKILDELYKKAGRPGHPLYPEKLLWTPYKLKYEF